MIFYATTLQVILVFLFKVKRVLGTDNSHLLEGVNKQYILSITQVYGPVVNILKGCKTSVPASKLRALAPHLVSKQRHTAFEKTLVTHLQAEFVMAEIVMLINDCKALVTHVKQGAASMREKLPLTLKQCCETRWNSLLTTLNSIHLEYDEVSKRVKSKNC